MTRTVLIVEDEPVAAETLERYLAGEDGFEVVGRAGTGTEALEALEKERPDVVLLDVELPEMSGIEVLIRADHDPAVIFTTAYDQHAVTAFELGAFDYLVKPFGRERFLRALARVTERLEAGADPSPSTARRARTALSGSEHLERLFVRSAGSIVPVDTRDVRRLEASGDYVEVHVEDASYLVSLTMAEFESRLDPERFLRVHRSHIVNLDHVERVEEHDRRRLRVVLDDGSAVVASRSGSRELRRLAV